ncbi:MAG: LamG domain-containing protein [Solirubrobacteraceae bacterium]
MYVRTGLTVLLFALAAAIPASASAATNLGAFWHLDEGSGTRAGDTSGNANHGTIQGSPSRNSGRFGRSLRFDGVDDRVVIPRSATLEPAAVTVEGWVRASASPGAFRHIVSQGANACEVASYGLTTAATGGIAFYASTGTDDLFAVSPAATPAEVWDGAWHHVAGTYDGAAVRLYVDGIEVDGGTPATFAIGYGLASPDGVLGAFGGTCALNYAGDLDEPRVWRRALRADEIAASAAMGGAATTTLDERIDSSQAIVYTSAFSNASNIKIGIESATGTERITSVRIQALLPLLGLASCRNDLLGLLLSQCDIRLSNDGKTAAVSVRKLNLFSRGVVLRVTLTSGRTFDVDVAT